ncbi:MAG: M61 family metallopeptidase [Cardiobacteriaceae bacterium]|nr:M61 family metallopeptidase [Cardiobacteriaceae bacterium]
MSQVSYSCRYLSAHRLLITVNFSASNNPELMLPIWIPGSYTRRDFSRLLTMQRAFCDGKTAEIHTISPSNWQLLAENTGEREQHLWQLEYEIYARDVSVRGCYADNFRIIFNPCAACVQIKNQENLPHLLDLSALGDGIFGAQLNAGTARFQDYQELIDTPFLIDREAISAEFQLAGVPHEIVLSGAENLDCVPENFLRDIEKITAAAHKIFGKFPEKLRRYSFLMFFTADSYGGLEHQSSTLLMESRESLSPHASREQYQQLIGLFAHEYFHLWNVKFIRPKIFRAGYRLDCEQIFPELWFFEGFTAYFDNLLLARSHTISPQEYLELLAQDISFYLSRAGSRKQSLAEASITAWTKGYNGGENSQNSNTSYYRHGALAAWTMDAFLQKHSDFSLADLMQRVFVDAEIQKTGLDKSEFLRIANSLLPSDKQAEFAELCCDLIESRKEINLAQTAEHFGLKLEKSPLTGKQINSQLPNCPVKTEAGFALQTLNSGRFALKITDPDAEIWASAAAGDEILSINNQAPSASNIWKLIFQNSRREKIELLLMRGGLINRAQFQLNAAENKNAKLSFARDELTAKQKYWLFGEK